MTALQQPLPPSKHTSPIILQAGAWCDLAPPYSTESTELTSTFQSYWSTQLDISEPLNAETPPQHLNNPSAYSNTQFHYSDTSHESTTTPHPKRQDTSLWLSKSNLSNIEMLEKWLEEQAEQEPVRMFEIAAQLAA